MPYSNSPFFKQRSWRILILPAAVLLVAFVARTFANSTMPRADLSQEEQLRVARIVQPAIQFDTAERFESMQAGAATNKSRTGRGAFSQPQSNLTFADGERFSLGNALFRKLWVSSPSSTLASDGLGPLFNARVCQACHIKDGRGHLPTNGEKASSLVLSLTRNNDDGLETADPHYGRQIQTFAVPGLLAEGDININYETKNIQFNDGDTIVLRRPVLSLHRLNYGPVPAKTILSARIAPPMIGLGLLEAIADDDIRHQADPDDEDEDGVSGRVSVVRSGGYEVIGRFGYRASQPSVKLQSAAAFASDLGLSTSHHVANAGDCTSVQTQCLSLPDGEQLKLGNHEVPDPLLDFVSFYSANLAPPKRRSVSDAQVLRGKAQFYNAGCVDCHVPKYVTSKQAENTQHQFQLIWP